MADNSFKEIFYDVVEESMISERYHTSSETDPVDYYDIQEEINDMSNDQFLEYLSDAFDKFLPLN